MKRFLVIGCLIATCHTYADDDIQNAIDELSNKAHNTGMYIKKNEDGEVVLTNEQPQNNFDKFSRKVPLHYAPELFDSPLDRSPNVKIGMTKAQVEAHTTWGIPSSVSKTTDAYGVIEIWHYDVSKMLVFKNGRLVTIYE
ncbi:hypothetical protein [Psychrobacter pygoscelis]|uniref:hypothetical protein n=1 Tax=Psychrobacter pygoscelis TaxID=2488563 RepID=UPI001040D1CD|nr:hypothetical protein [Psychrobacter pygoscelis]